MYEVLGKFMGGLCVIVISTILRGFVLVQLWAWFVVPQFGLAPLPFANALGLGLIVTYLTYKIDTKGDPNYSFIGVMSVGVLWSLMALGFGFIYSLFV